MPLFISVRFADGIKSTSLMKNIEITKGKCKNILWYFF